MVFFSLYGFLRVSSVSLVSLGLFICVVLVISFSINLRLCCHVAADSKPQLTLTEDEPSVDLWRLIWSVCRMLKYESGENLQDHSGFIWNHGRHRKHIISIWWTSLTFKHYSSALKYCLDLVQTDLIRERWWSWFKETQSGLCRVVKQSSVDFVTHFSI